MYVFSSFDATILVNKDVYMGLVIKAQNNWRDKDGLQVAMHLAIANFCSCHYYFYYR